MVCHGWHLTYRISHISSWRSGFSLRQPRGYDSGSEEEEEDDEEGDSQDGMAHKSEAGEDGGLDEEDADEEQGDDTEQPLSATLSPTPNSLSPLSHPLLSGEQQQDAVGEVEVVVEED